MGSRHHHARGRLCVWRHQRSPRRTGHAPGHHRQQVGAASMCYNSCPWFEPWIERCRKPRGERCWEEIPDEEERLHALVEEDNVEDDNGDDSHPGIQPA